ncbi:MAG TPA: thiamine-phosphate kinase [Mycobacteriales bacterium]|nr:thiamine-phosphate kinase [Mycobacteriales bacterium]
MADRTRPEGERVIPVSDPATGPSLRELGEFGLIGLLAARLPQPGSVLIGPGDDAAVLAAPDGRVVATVDVMVEGRHFRRDWSNGYDVGRRAAAASLADIVAMGATPTALLVGLTAPGDLEAEWALQLADGLREECAPLGAGVAGGDVTAGDAISISVTALGDLGGREPLTRAGARPGDTVVVVGRLGWATAGLALLEAGLVDHPLAAAHRRPVVSYDLARRLAASDEVSSMIDVSDGLLADLTHVAVASGVAIAVESASLPVDPEVARAAEELGVDPLLWVGAGGDDHAFAATVRGTVPAGAVVIGRVVAAEVDAARIATFTDRETPARGGHAHFS